MNDIAEYLSLNSVRAGYRRTDVLHDVTLSIETGFHVLLGPNGAGKTTLFRVIATVLRARSGRLAVLGRDVASAAAAGVKRWVGYLPHRAGLYPELTVEENLVFWGRILRMSRGEQAAAVGRISERLRLAPLLGKRVAELSRGQVQLCAAARTLLGAPRILLLDEPTAGLDPVAARNLREQLIQLADGETAIIMATHNLFEAAACASRVIVLREGRVVAHMPVGDLPRELKGTRQMTLRAEGDPGAVLTRLNVSPIRVDTATWKIEVRDPAEAARVVEALVAEGVRVTELRDMGNPLEDLYLNLVSGEERA